MKKIIIILVLFFTIGCTSSKDLIVVYGYTWSVTLVSGDYATGFTQNKNEGKKNIKDFSNQRKSNIKKQNIKKGKKKIKKPNFK